MGDGGQYMSYQSNLNTNDQSTSIDVHKGLSIGAMVVGGIAMVVAIAAIVMVVLLWRQEKETPVVPTTPPLIINKYGSASFSKQTTDPTGITNYYVSPTSYNLTNIVIPVVDKTVNNVRFTIDANNVSIGDMFSIDNSNNPDLTFYVNYTNFDNMSGDIIINKNPGAYSVYVAFVQITAGRTTKGKNIILSSSPVSYFIS